MELVQGVQILSRYCNVAVCMAKLQSIKRLAGLIEMIQMESLCIFTYFMVNIFSCVTSQLILSASASLQQVTKFALWKCQFCDKVSGPRAKLQISINLSIVLAFHRRAHHLCRSIQ